MCEQCRLIVEVVVDEAVGSCVRMRLLCFGIKPYEPMAGANPQFVAIVLKHTKCSRVRSKGIHFIWLKGVLLGIVAQNAAIVGRHKEGSIG